MLEEKTKKIIQQAYSEFLAAKTLKPRYSQKLMIAEIAKTLGNIQLDEKGHNTASPNIAVVEAGTGTGKTIAYLLSTLPIAQQLEKQVVLSTATVALQEQIIYKDLPELLRHSGLDFSFALAKGRGRYVCLSKLERILSESGQQATSLYPDEAISLSSSELGLYRDMMQKSVDGDWDGDRDSWRDALSSDEWQRVTTDHRQCTGRKCSNIRDCAFFNARNALENADCIVANHDLVLADLALGGGAILSAPEETIYILDEAHHLPEKTLNHFSVSMRLRSTIRWLGQSEAQWPAQLKALQDLSYFSQLAEPLERCFSNARSVLEQGLPVVRTLCEEVDIDRPSPKLRFQRGEVSAELEQIAEQAAQAFQKLHSVVDKMYREIDAIVNADSHLVARKDIEAMHAQLGAWVNRTQNAIALWESYRATGFNIEQPMARWVALFDSNSGDDFELVSSPVLASSILQKDLWERCCGAVLTSATIRALNSFDRFFMKSGLSENAHTCALSSPFDFQNNATLCIPKESVEANLVIQHTESLISLLPQIIDVSEGTLVLFASHTQMNQVYESLPTSLEKRVRCQGYESKQRIIEIHKRNIDRGEGSVIWGLASFAEGIDLPGEYCSHVIIAKLPFAVPDEPVEAAFSEWIEARGGNAFMEVAIPEVSVRLTQSCGRLLRTESDSGRVTILDKRLISKRYGQALLDALPPFRRQI